MDKRRNPEKEKDAVEEREAWDNLEARMNFLADVFGDSDPTSITMATEKLAQAISRHDAEYEKRIKKIGIID